MLENGQALTAVERSADKRLFLTIAHNSANPVEYFGLPIGQTISMGAEVLL